MELPLRKVAAELDIDTSILSKIERNERAATQKSKGIVYTNLEKYKVSVSYIEDIKGYKFSDGAINMLFNRTKKEKVFSNNTYDVSVKATETPLIPKSLIYLKATDLFKIK